MKRKGRKSIRRVRLNQKNSDFYYAKMDELFEKNKCENIVPKAEEVVNHILNDSADFEKQFNMSVGDYIQDQKYKKTSAEWAKEKEFINIVVMDPIGWNRQNENDTYSWERERITKREFLTRLHKSKYDTRALSKCCNNIVNVTHKKNEYNLDTIDKFLCSECNAELDQNTLVPISDK